MSSELAEIKQAQPPQSLSIFNDAEAFRQAATMAQFLAKSTLVPKDYQNNESNAMIAIDIARRIGASPLMVMQNLYVIHGKPSWSSSFIISAINSCGRFAPLRFEVTGTGDEQTCKAWTTDASGVIEGPIVSIAMAKKEGWWSKQGSKWPTMTDLMLRYRAAAFFGRLYAPDILNGMYTADEVADFATPEPRAAKVIVTTSEPFDDGLLTTATKKAIEAALAALGRVWDSPTMELAEKVVGRKLGDASALDDLSEPEGAVLVKALNRSIENRAKQPKK